MTVRLHQCCMQWLIQGLFLPPPADPDIKCDLSQYNSSQNPHSRGLFSLSIGALKLTCCIEQFKGFSQPSQPRKMEGQNSDRSREMRTRQVIMVTYKYVIYHSNFL